MKNDENESPLKSFGKEYFKGLLKDKRVDSNFRLGNELRFGIQFLDKDGNVTKTYIETIRKDELDND